MKRREDAPEEDIGGPTDEGEEQKQMVEEDTLVLESLPTTSYAYSSNVSFLAQPQSVEGALEELCTEMSEDRSIQRHREKTSALRMYAMTRAIVRLTQASSTLSKRTLTLHVELGQFSGDVLRVLDQITAATEATQTAHIASGVAAEAPDSEFPASAASLP
ncbi:hypothetical protein NDU88_006632 [Pleurodeles waltl]|uniref:Uncharacterized protein n=1 Tax=Pleurodeles waltl TaxID=8319 RepID=A0AAV7N1W8_PLEWA|nr:hypothetical protein NDU88_006632 [Pleurodeles waltl]